MSGESVEAVEIRDILRLLPHRYPFIMVDRIIDIRGDESGIGIKNVTMNEPQFLGHFPENPVMPGVLMIEGMAQTAAALVLRRLDLREQRSMFLITIDKAKFRKPAVPGDRLEYHVSKSANRRFMWWYQAEAKVGATLDCRGAARRNDRRGEIVIDPTARVAEGARIGEGVEIGPYCIVGSERRAADGVRLIAHVHVTGVTTIGEGTVVYPFASLGTPPQSVHYRGGATRLVIGQRCEMREDVTMNTGTGGWRRCDYCRRALLVHGRLACRARLSCG